MATIKTALSIEESLFERADALARELDVSRSKVFAMALKAFLKQHESEKLLERINAVYADASPRDEKEVSARRARHRELVEGTW